jgi:tRNA(fMet)-specific endonuclease VapC
LTGKVGSSYLLDTNVVIAYLNSESALQEKLKALEEANATLSISTTIAGELYFGAYKSGRVTANVAQLKNFLNTFNTFICDTATAEQYGQIKMQLRAKGKPIPENDIWIAATALQHHLILISRDEHFKEVNGIRIERW